MQNRKQRRIAAWLAAMFFLPAAAQAASLSLDEALNAAQKYSAALSANQHQVNALENMADSATQLPDPKLKFGIENVPVGGDNGRRLTREGMTMQRIGIMQDYVSSEKRERKADTLRAEAAKTAANSLAIRAQLQRDTAQAWLDLALAQRSEEQAKKLVNEGQRQVPLQNASVANGSAPSSAIDARLTLAAMQDLVTDASRDVQVAQARLMQLTGENDVRTAGSLPRYQRLPAERDVLIQAIDEHPEVLQAKRESDVAHARSEQTALAAIPDVGVEVYYAKRGDDYEDMAGVMFTVDLPLFKSKRQDKDYAAEVSRSMEANDQLTLLQRDHRAQLDTLIAQYQAAQSRWQRQQQEIVPLQQQKIRLLEAQYRAGSSSLAEVMSGRRALLESELASVTAEREMAKIWASIRYLIPQEFAQ